MFNVPECDHWYCFWKYQGLCCPCCLCLFIFWYRPLSKNLCYPWSVIEISFGTSFHPRKYPVYWTSCYPWCCPWHSPWYCPWCFPWCFVAIGVQVVVLVTINVVLKFFLKVKKNYEVFSSVKYRKLYIHKMIYFPLSLFYQQIKPKRISLWIISQETLIKA